MGFVEDARCHFASDDLYEILGLRRGDTAAQVKKAYYKQSLKCHPDRFSSNQEEPSSSSSLRDSATARFQILARAYAILSDSEQRKVYDETGMIHEEDVDDNLDWTIRWRNLFRKVTLEDIDKFCARYRGSEEEREDVRLAYQQSKGDMAQIINLVLGSTIDDESRFSEMIRQMIKTGEVKQFKAFIKDNPRKAKARRRKADKEAEEAEVLLKEIQEREGQTSLSALIKRRHNPDQMNAFYDHLAEKYAPPPRKQRSKK